MRSERYKEVMKPINEARRYVDEARQALEGLKAMCIREELMKLWHYQSA